jgi:hypothetical protein
MKNACGTSGPGTLESSTNLTTNRMGKASHSGSPVRVTSEGGPAPCLVQLVHRRVAPGPGKPDRRKFVHRMAPPLVVPQQQPQFGTSMPVAETVHSIRSGHYGSAIYALGGFLWPR